MIRADGLYLPEPGDLLRHSETKEMLLVGDVNAGGGICDDCFEAPWSDFVETEERPDPEILRFWHRLDKGWELIRNVLKDASS